MNKEMIVNYFKCPGRSFIFWQLAKSGVIFQHILDRLEESKRKSILRKETKNAKATNSTKFAAIG